MILDFTVSFHSAFRVGSAYARDGVGAALDRHDPLPADHLKGLMRSAARDLLGLPAATVGEVFGDYTTPSPWSWSAARPAGDDWDFTFRHRVTIDPGTHSAVKDRLVLGEQAWADRARFQVQQAGAISRSAEPRHVLVLRCSAAAVHGLGSWRRRGLGWIGIAPDDPVSPGDVAELLALAGAGR